MQSGHPARGATLSARTWPDGSPLGPDGALEAIVVFLSEPSQGLVIRALATAACTAA
jgi:hypothetical protein